MKIVHINMTADGSTGKIMLGQAEVGRQHGHEVYTFSTEMYHKGQRPVYRKIKGHSYFGTYFENHLHYVLGRVLGLNGIFSVFGTYSLIRKVKAIQPDVVHLHNIHGYCFCMPLFFHYLKKHHIRVVWTLHDCWTMTGQCAHFALAKCNKWKTGCERCVQHNSTYPKSLVDASKLMWNLKKRWITGVRDITFVTPSQWLADLVRQSYLKSYPVKVVNNGINIDVFKPTENSFKETYGITNPMVLGVAFDWGIRKGTDVFVHLAERMKNSYQIVLVGISASSKISFPDNIITIDRTKGQKELAEIYSAADVFVNPTREDNYPTVNMEALACGTPVVTFRTGGSAEIIDETCGIAVACDDFEALVHAIEYVCKDKPFSSAQCRCRGQQFDEKKRTAGILNIYAEL